MLLIQNNNLQLNKWEKLLSNSTYASPFQTPQFYNFCNSIDKLLSADVFAIEKNNKFLSLVVITIQKEKGIKESFSQRGIIYGGPLLLSNETESLSLLLESINSYYKKKLVYIESRNFFDYAEYKIQFQQHSFKYIPWLNFHLDTSDIDVMQKNMSNSRLRQVKKAIKNGVSWKVADDVNDIHTFYNILADLYKNKIKKPLFVRDFFIQQFEQKFSKFLLVYYQKKVIGGILCPIIEKKAIYEFYICGLDQEYKNQYPSVMATWAAMKYANQNGIPLLDFMGAGNPNKDYGVREFKSRFGGKQVEHGRYIKILNPFLYRVGILGLKFLSKIKK